MKPVQAPDSDNINHKKAKTVKILTYQKFGVSGGAYSNHFVAELIELGSFRRF